MGEQMRGKICLVTGATAGIGLETAKSLAQQGATLIIVGRNREKCEHTVRLIKQQTGVAANAADVEFMLADLSSQQAVRQLAAQFKSKYQRLHVLVNNAGAIFFSRQQSVDGIELTFALNHLAYFLLTNLLLDTLIASAPARIVNVSSGAHQGGRINFDDLQGQQRYRGMNTYAQSKLANVLFTVELARRLAGTGVTANALHPGLVASNFALNNGRLVRLWRPISRLLGISPAEGARTVIYLATAPEVEGTTGKYFYKQKAVPAAPASDDRATASQLWQISEDMTGLKAVTS